MRMMMMMRLMWKMKTWSDAAMMILNGCGCMRQQANWHLCQGQFDSLGISMVARYFWAGRLSMRFSVAASWTWFLSLAPC